MMNYQQLKYPLLLMILKTEVFIKRMDFEWSVQSESRKLQNLFLRKKHPISFIEGNYLNCNSNPALVGSERPQKIN